MKTKAWLGAFLLVGCAAMGNTQQLIDYAAPPSLRVDAPDPMIEPIARLAIDRGKLSPFEPRSASLDDVLSAWRLARRLGSEAEAEALRTRALGALEASTRAERFAPKSLPLVIELIGTRSLASGGTTTLVDREGLARDMEEIGSLWAEASVPGPPPPGTGLAVAQFELLVSTMMEAADPGSSRESVESALAKIDAETNGNGTDALALEAIQLEQQARVLAIAHAQRGGDAAFAGPLARAKVDDQELDFLVGVASRPDQQPALALLALEALVTEARLQVFDGKPREGLGEALTVALDSIGVWLGQPSATIHRYRALVMLYGAFGKPLDEMVRAVRLEPSPDHHALLAALYVGSLRPLMGPEPSRDLVDGSWAEAVLAEMEVPDLRAVLVRHFWSTDRSRSLLQLAKLSENGIPARWADWVALAKFGAAIRESGDVEALRGQVERIAAGDGNQRANALMLLAVDHGLAGRKEKARELIARAAQLAPEDPDVAAVATLLAE